MSGGWCGFPSRASRVSACLVHQTLMIHVTFAGVYDATDPEKDSRVGSRQCSHGGPHGRCPRRRCSHLGPGWVEAASHLLLALGSPPPLVPKAASRQSRPGGPVWRGCARLTVHSHRPTLLTWHSLSRPILFKHHTSWQEPSPILQRGESTDASCRARQDHTAAVTVTP